jgi:hypothetical protein
VVATRGNVVIEIKVFDKAINNENLRENKNLKKENNHFVTEMQKFTKGQYLQSELLMNTVKKLDMSAIGYQYFRKKKAQP